MTPWLHVCKLNKRRRKDSFKKCEPQVLLGYWPPKKKKKCLTAIIWQNQSIIPKTQMQRTKVLQLAIIRNFKWEKLELTPPPKAAWTNIKVSSAKKSTATKNNTCIWSNKSNQKICLNKRKGKEREQ